MHDEENTSATKMLSIPPSASPPLRQVLSLYSLMYIAVATLAIVVCVSSAYNKKPLQTSNKKQVAYKVYIVAYKTNTAKYHALDSSR